jgi:hypothetical protein
LALAGINYLDAVLLTVAILLWREDKTSFLNVAAVERD